MAWGIADEYLEEQRKEFENNNVEFLRNKVASLKEVIDKRDKEIEECDKKQGDIKSKIKSLQRQKRIYEVIFKKNSFVKFRVESL